MTRTELEELARALGGAPTGNDTEGLLRALLETAGAEEAGGAGAMVARLVTGASEAAEAIVAGGTNRVNSRDAGVVAPTGESRTTGPAVAATLSALLSDGRGLGTAGTGQAESARRLGADIAALLPLPAARVPAPVVSGTTAGRSGGESGGSMAGSVLKTIGMATGVGPVVTGLMKLFGGGGSTAPTAYSPIPYSLPEQISVEAGLSGDRTFVPVGYSAAGGVRSMAPPTGGRSGGGQMAPIQINVQAMDSRSFADHSDDIARAVREAMLHSHSLNDVISEI